MLLVCDVCSWSEEGGERMDISFSRCEDWNEHLLSPDHEFKLKPMLIERCRHQDDAAFLVLFEESGDIPSRQQLFKFCTERGIVSQFYYDESGRFGVVKVDQIIRDEIDTHKMLSEGSFRMNGEHLVNLLKANKVSDGTWKFLKEKSDGTPSPPQDPARPLQQFLTAWDAQKYGYPLGPPYPQHGGGLYRQPLGYPSQQYGYPLGYPQYPQHGGGDFTLARGQVQGEQHMYRQPLGYPSQQYGYPFGYPQYPQHGGGDVTLASGQVQDGQHMYRLPPGYSSPWYGYPHGYSGFREFYPPPPLPVHGMALPPPKHTQTLSNSADQMSQNFSVPILPMHQDPTGFQPSAHYPMPILPMYPDHTGFQPPGIGYPQQRAASGQTMGECDSVTPPGPGSSDM